MDTTHGSSPSSPGMWADAEFQELLDAVIEPGYRLALRLTGHAHNAGLRAGSSAA